MCVVGSDRSPSFTHVLGRLELGEYQPESVGPPAEQGPVFCRCSRCLPDLGPKARFSAPEVEDGSQAPAEVGDILPVGETTHDQSGAGCSDRPGWDQVEEAQPYALSPGDDREEDEAHCSTDPGSARERDE